MTGEGCGRRQFLSAGLGLAGLALSRRPVFGACAPFSDQAAACPPVSWMDGGRSIVEGYAGRRSYEAGERVSFFMSSQSRVRAMIEVSRLGARREKVWSGPVWVEPKVIPADASESGCMWDGEEGGELSFDVPIEWNPGFYHVTMHASSGDGEGFFIVRPRRSDRKSGILLILSTNTYFAYNNYGAAQGNALRSTHGSFYDQARVASFHRPLPLGFLSPYDCRKTGMPSRHQRYAGWDKWEWPFVRWAERAGIALDYAANEDLEWQPDLLESYRLILSVGHDEYWSASMRNAVERYVRQGGNAVFLSGNVAYRRVRLGLSDSRMILDGEMDGDALWSHLHGANRPEHRLTGVSFCYGALNPAPVPYRIYQPDHWLFDGLWPAGGRPDRFPEVGCIGYECDGCDIKWDKGVPTASHRDGCPDDFQILGLAPGRMPDYEAAVHSRALFDRDDGFTPWGADLRRGAAVMGIWTNGGTVVTVGCTEWARHLDDPLVSQITRNALAKLSQ
ncbi:MAG TPA: hypothetical protein PKA61_08710 [Nitrospira sp.]|nr:hypothetical protein [Nitrospira sp.]